MYKDEFLLTSLLCLFFALLIITKKENIIRKIVKN